MLAFEIELLHKALYIFTIYSDSSFRVCNNLFRSTLTVHVHERRLKLKINKPNLSSPCWKRNIIYFFKDRNSVLLMRDQGSF